MITIKFLQLSIRLQLAVVAAFVGSLFNSPALLALNLSAPPPGNPAWRKAAEGGENHLSKKRFGRDDEPNGSTCKQTIKAISGNTSSSKTCEARGKQRTPVTSAADTFVFINLCWLIINL